jgi:hypothetical protein
MHPGNGEKDERGRIGDNLGGVVVLDLSLGKGGMSGSLYTAAPSTLASKTHHRQNKHPLGQQQEQYILS